MQEDSIYFANPQKRKHLIYKYLKSQKSWNGFLFVQSVVYFVSAVLFIAGIVIAHCMPQPKYSPGVSAMVLFVFWVFAGVLFVAAWSGKKEYFYFEGIPFSARANESIQIIGENMIYRYVFVIKKDKAVFTGVRDNVADYEQSTCTINRNDISEVVINAGVCLIKGKDEPLSFLMAYDPEDLEAIKHFLIGEGKGVSHENI